MMANFRNIRSNLSHDIDRARNYYEHRRRVQHTRNFSPFATLKKSISYDRQKLALYDYIKYRKVCSNSYHKRQHLKHNETNDTKMLKNILEYDQKQFVFSINYLPNGNSSLSHNSMISHNKNSHRIDQQNQKIHFRITKTKSLYSHLFPCKSSISPLRQLRHFEKERQTTSKQQSLPFHTEEQDIPNEEEIEQQSKNFHLVNILPASTQKFKIDFPSPQLEAASENLNKKEKDLSNSILVRSNTTRKICQRLRRQRLAQNLFQKKQKWQSKISSKLNINKP